MAQVLFKYGTRAQYNALAEKQSNALYFLTDTNELYRGDVGICQPHLYSGSMQNDESLATAQARILDGAIAVNGDIMVINNVTYFYAGSWVQITPDPFHIDSDNKSIETTEDNVIRLNDFGVKYYKYVAAVEGHGEEGDEDYVAPVAAHYEVQMVDTTHPWKSGLEPRVVNENGDLVIGWYEPNPTTFEGVNSQVVAIQGDIEDLENTTEDLRNDVDDIAEILNGTEEVDGLVANVADLTDRVDIIEDSITNIFHFRGVQESVEDLEVIEAPAVGDVYQVGASEYAFFKANDDDEGSWAELGPVISFDGYATEDDVDGAISTLKAVHNSDIAGLQSRIDAIDTGIMGVKVNGSTLTPVSGIVDISMPTFNGKVAGLVPVAELAEDAVAENYVFNAAGAWMDVDAKIEAAKVVWETI